jgi:hypothetical protein
MQEATEQALKDGNIAAVLAFLHARLMLLEDTPTRPGFTPQRKPTPPGFYRVLLEDLKKDTDK